MEWNTFEHLFCENKITGKPEILNILSSIPYILLGTYFTLKKTTDITLKILFNLCILVGVGSICFHWSGYFGWRLFDEIPMILIEFFILYCLEDILIKLDRNRELLLTYNNPPWRGSVKVLNVKMFIYNFCMIVFIIIDSTPDTYHIFPFVFASIFMLNMYKLHRVKKELIYFSEVDHIETNIKKSSMSIFISIIIWASTEITCKYYQSPILLVGHPLWHILSAYGLFNILNAIFQLKNSILIQF